MTPFKRGEVVLLPFPYTDQSGSKRRPAVIVSATDYNSRRPDLIVAPITSNVSTGQADDIPIHDWAPAGLLKPSVVKGILGTVEQALVIRRMGNFSATDFTNVEKSFARTLGMTGHTTNASPPGVVK
jgi:mRNA interferase MazF